VLPICSGGGGSGGGGGGGGGGIRALGRRPLHVGGHPVADTAAGAAAVCGAPRVAALRVDAGEQVRHGR